MNFKKTSFFIALIFCAFVTTGNATENSLLWKVSGNGLSKPSYLFGTHHLVPLSFLDTVNGWDEAFEQTEQTIGELVLTNIMEMQMQMMQHAMMPEGHSYQTLLSADDYALLDSKLTSLMGVGLAQVGQMNPAMLGNIITLGMYQQMFPELASGESIDLHFQQEAMKRQRPVLALESIDDQIHVLFYSRSLERQIETMMCLLKHPDRLEKTMNELHEAYFAHNLDALYALTDVSNPNDPCPTTPEEMNAMNKDRNLRWMEKLPAMMREKSSFVAVGALHLPGENGLIEGLRRKGFTVEPVL